MLFTILNFFFTVIIIILFVRYFVEKYRFYGFGPVMVAVVTITERLIKPLKKVVPQSAYHLEEHMPLVAIGVTLLIRGLVIWLIKAGPMDIMVRLHDAAGGGLAFLYAIAISFSMGFMLLAELLIAFLFASVMVSRRGITMGATRVLCVFRNGLLRCSGWCRSSSRAIT